MVNRALFNTKKNVVPVANTVNQAGGLAYSFSDEHALCQYVATGTFNGVYYASESEQLTAIKNIAAKCSSEMLAKAAVYGHEVGRMKDVPAYLCAVLAARGETALLAQIFPRVIDTSKMLSNFITIIRSGETGRKSFGTAVKRLIQNWFTSRDAEDVFKQSIGQADPSFADMIRMVHPKPPLKKDEALYGYMLDKPHQKRNLPAIVKQFEAFKADNSNPLPVDMPFRALTNCKLTTDHWKQLAVRMPWNTLRMNINMLERNGVFLDSTLTAQLAAKLSDEREVRRAKALPYQLLTTYQNVGTAPQIIQNALQDALELSTENIPVIDGNIAVCIDLSGSMSSPITGNRGSVSSKTTVMDVATLMGASFARTNPHCRLIGWASAVGEIRINTRDSIVTNARKLAGEHARFGGGTNVELALQMLNNEGWKGSLIVYISDNESWMGRPYRQTTGMAQQWATFQARNPKAKLVCVDIQPYTSTQVPDMKNVLNVGGFSDDVFNVIANFVKFGDGRFVDTVKAVQL